MNNDDRYCYTHKPVKHDAIYERVPNLRGARFLPKGILSADDRLNLSCDRKDDSGTKDHVMPQLGRVEPVEFSAVPENDNSHRSKERQKDRIINRER